ncbi:MAG: cysteine desulfurase, partial [Candidatus Berkelbacteria bacterium Licking1014_85]
SKCILRADFLHCDPVEIIFNSGATEGNNTVVNSVRYYQFATGKKPHIISTLLEHPSVSDPIKELEKYNLAEVTWIKPNRAGVVNAQKIIDAIKKNTALISVVYANHETGAIQPIRGIGKLLEKSKSQFLNPKQIQNTKYKILNTNYPIFHSDITQAIGWENCEPRYLHCDAVTFSGHKIHSFKGVGVLYLKTNTPIHPLIFGGNQEFGQRPGTINHIAAFTLAKAIANLKKWQKISQKVAKIKKYLEINIKKIYPNAIILSEKTERTSHISGVVFPKIDNQKLLINLDQQGIAVSIGSACLSGSFQPSKTMLAMGYSEDLASSVIRISLSKDTTKAQIDYFIQTLKQVLSFRT